MAKAKKAEEEEVEDDLEDGEEQATEKPKGKLFSWLKLPSLKLPSRKVMIIAAAGLLVLGGGGGGAYFYFFKGSEHEAPAKLGRSSPRSSSICPTCWSICRMPPANVRNISK